MQWNRIDDTKEGLSVYEIKWHGYEPFQVCASEIWRTLPAKLHKYLDKFEDPSYDYIKLCNELEELVDIKQVLQDYLDKYIDIELFVSTDYDTDITPEELKQLQKVLENLLK